MSDFESDDDLPFTPVPRGYLYEPEYTDEELLQIENDRAERERRERELTEQAEEEPMGAERRERLNASWWCSCQKCQPMPTELESYCCREWELAARQMQELTNPEEPDASSACITSHQDFPAIINSGVLRTFFNLPKINWRKKPRPAGPDGQLSVKQYRLVGYRMVLEWALNGEQLGKGNRRVLPACVVNMIRQTYPSANGQYVGFKESEESLALF